MQTVQFNAANSNQMLQLALRVNLSAFDLSE